MGVAPPPKDKKPAPRDDFAAALAKAHDAFRAQAYKDASNWTCVKQRVWPSNQSDVPNWPNQPDKIGTLGIPSDRYYWKFKQLREQRDRDHRYLPAPIANAAPSTPQHLN